MKGALLLILLLCWSLPASALLIEQDSRWSGERAYAEDVRIAPGVTLTVAPGTILRFTAGKLEIAGRLDAQGATFTGQGWQGLVLKGTEASARLTDCLIEGAATGLFIQGGTPVLERLTLRGNDVGMELRGRAAGRISNCRFEANRKVGLFLKDDSTTAVADCLFANNGRFGAYLYRALPAEFAGNRFEDNATGLMVAYHGSDPLIAGNRFVRNDVGIQVDRAARPQLRGNRLQGNRTGIHVYRRADPLVAGNRIAGNDTGLLIGYSSYPQVEGNDFVDNRLAVKLEFQSSRWEREQGAAARAGESASRSAFAGQGARTVTEQDRRATHLDGTVPVAGNWWGEEGTAELARIGAAGNPSFIHDGRDQPTFEDGGKAWPLDLAVFAPWSGTALTETLP